MFLQVVKFILFYFDGEVVDLFLIQLSTVVKTDKQLWSSILANSLRKPAISRSK